MAKGCANLLLSSQAGKIEVHAEDAQPLAFEPEIGPNGTARLDRRQMESFSLLNLDIAPNEQGIAVPAEATWPSSDRSRAPGCVIEPSLGKHGLAFSEAIVAFLQGDHISMEFAQHGDDPIRITPPVNANSLVNVVTGKG